MFFLIVLIFTQGAVVYRFTYSGRGAISALAGKFKVGTSRQESIHAKKVPRLYPIGLVIILPLYSDIQI